MTVRTRFAPSPTGLLHVGSARTALFNFLFARHHGGDYLLRIEDTDRERNSADATKVILDGLAWLELSPDQPPVYQSTREARHVEVADELLARGHAYRCYCSQEELREMREQAVREGRPPRYDGRWRDRDPAEAPAGVAPTIRLKAPRTGETVVDDLVQGTVRVGNAELDDMIILRANRAPTYLHAVVVDDHDMGITHVIRGDDHLTNTFRQIQIYEAMAWAPPRFGHLPLIHGPDGAKLSKRHGAVSVLEFRNAGILPEALCNYLLRLGWGHGDAEIIDRAEAIKLFDIDGVGRAASRMDYAKLTHLNGVYIRAADDGRLTEEVLAHLAERPGLVLSDQVKIRIKTLMPGLKERAKSVVELANSATFLALAAPIALDDKARAVLTDDAKAMLRDLTPALAATDFTIAGIDAMLRTFAESTGRKLGQVAQPLRAVLTGTTTSPGIDSTLAALGREESLARIAVALGDDFSVSPGADLGEREQPKAQIREEF